MVPPDIAWPSFSTHEGLWSEIPYYFIIGNPQYGTFPKFQDLDGMCMSLNIK